MDGKSGRTGCKRCDLEWEDHEYGRRALVKSGQIRVVWKSLEEFCISVVIFRPVSECLSESVRLYYCRADTQNQRLSLERDCAFRINDAPEKTCCKNKIIFGSLCAA
jgi:hypothetical protein